MSLAATLAADGMRPASFVPVVKCSHCEEEIEIASMGAHRCHNMHPAPVSSDNNAYHDEPPQSPTQQHYSICDPYTLNSHQSIHGPSPLQYSQQPDEPMPPMPDWIQDRSTAWDLPAMNAPPTLPHIQTDFLNPPLQACRSPVVQERNSPALSTRSGGGGGGGGGGDGGGERSPFLRTKAPHQPGLFDSRPPSESLSPNLDCAFPPFPVSNNNPTVKRRPSQGRKTPATLNALPSSTHGRGFGPVTDDSLPLQIPTPFGENVLESVDSSPNGTFDSGRSSPDSHNLPSASASEHNRPVETNAFGIQGLDHHNRSMGEFDMARAESPPPLPSLPFAVDALKSVPPPRPARPTSIDVLSPGFLRQLSDDARVQPAALTVQSPPLPPKSPERGQFPRMLATLRGDGESLANGSDHSPRQQSLAHQGTPVPARLLRQDSAHAPSPSASSTASSTHSAMHSHSTNTTGSVGSATSSIDIFSPSSFNRPTFGEDGKGSGFEGHRTFGDDGKGSGYRLPQEPGLRAEMPVSRSPPRNSARPVNVLPEGDFDVTGPSAATNTEFQESPLDPALRAFSQIQNSPPEPTMRPPPMRTMTAEQSSQLFPEPTLPLVSYEPPPRLTIQTKPHSQSRGLSSPQETRQPSTATPVETRKALPPPPPEPIEPTPEPTEPTAKFPARQSSLRDPRRNRSKSIAGQGIPRHEHQPSFPANRLIIPPPRSDSYGQSGAVQSPRPRPPTAGKSHCRGCHEIIEGRSVKDSDGRLTGRWHRPCFKCRTCKQPFVTADFYVFNDQPYCEHHYHEKNGSLCHGCNLGIEGQYLEASTTSRRGRINQKYHPRCFTCIECCEVLKDDYHEFRGRVFCERHALAAMRSQAWPGRLAVPDARGMKAERRTTRLMMMGPGSFPGLS